MSTSTASHSSLSSRNVTGRRIAMIVMLGAVVFGRGVAFDYVRLDDDIVIEGNMPFLSRPAAIFEAFTKGYFFAMHRSTDTYYRPMVTVSYVMDTLISHGSPGFNHLTNLILHLVVSSLVFMVFLRLLRNRDTAFVLALVFAAHPLVSNAVGWIPGRNDLLLALFSLASFLLFARYLKSGKAADLIGMVVCFGLALLTKEVAVALLAVGAVYVWAMDRTGVTTKRAIRAGVIGLVPLIAWFAARSAVLGGGGQLPPTVVATITGNLPALALAIGNTFIPVDLSVMPTLTDANYLTSIVAIVLIAAGVFISKRMRIRIAVFAAAWYLLFMAPALAGKFEAAPSFLECRFYLPMIGLLLLAGEMDVLSQLDVKKRSTQWIAAGVIAALLIAAQAAYSPYANSFSFLEAAVRQSPHSSLAHSTLGIQYLNAKRGAEAERELRAAIALDTRQPMNHLALGTALFDRGAIDSAEAELNVEAAINPSEYMTYFELGRVAEQRGKMDDAIKFTLRSVQINPDHAAAWYNLSVYFFRLGDREQTRQCALKAQSLGWTIPDEIVRFVQGAPR